MTQKTKRPAFGRRDAHISNPITRREGNRMKNPLIPMVAVTGRPNEAEVRTFLHELNAVGIEQVMLYPRAGCELSYLSEEWFAVIGYFLKAAADLNMWVWLYDEFNWPSGDAGGRVTAVPEFRLKALTVKGERAGEVSNQFQNRGSLFAEKWFPDLLSPAATDAFIRCTHEEYYRRFADYFGTTVRGIFTDEASVGYCCTATSVPYYEGMKEDYETRYGRPFAKDMQKGEATFFTQVMQLVSDRFRTVYLQKINRWCADHGLLMTGHLMEDDNPMGSTRNSGDFLHNLSQLAVPGVDDIGTNFAHAPTHFSAVAYAAGQNGAMAELFALGPCDMSYAKKRCMLFYAAAFRVDHYFLAIAHMDMRGNRHIRDFFSQFMSDQPDFGGMRQLAEDAARAAAYAHRDFVPDVYIVYPYEICAAHICDPLSMEPYARLMKQLMQYQLQWKLLAAGEESGGIPTVSFTADMTYSLDGYETRDADEVCRRLNPRVWVSDEQGGRPQGLFVRRFADGGLLVLNTNGDKGVYRADGRSFELERYGVYESECPPAAFGRTESVAPTFSVTYGNDNGIRAMFVNEQTRATVRVTEPITVRLAVREDTDAQLGGRGVAVSKANPCLSRGWQPLYRYSEPLALATGEHEVCSKADFKFLPAVLLRGNFAAATHSGEVCEVTLSPRAVSYRAGERLRDFGQVTFAATVTVPHGAVALQIDGTVLYTTVALDGVTVGERIAAPYVFAVDPAVWGRSVELSVTQYSGMGPLFGDTAYWNEKSSDVGWNNTPPLTNETFGFSGMNWCFDKERD